MIKVLEYTKIVVDRAIIFEFPDNIEIIVRQKKSRRKIFKVMKNIFKTSEIDNQYKNDPIRDIHHGFRFK